ncbi:C39 family peptidase [Virgibacillus byunsanensis]|uniref:C39 family peptidase n=1 Tax=Virgibacillus byunsanensis TaxID=570945 RepID=A0ABW3LMY8_9BACI
MRKKLYIIIACLLVFFIGSMEAHALGLKIEGVPVYNQFPELPAGCESTSLAMLLGWAGLPVDKYDVVNQLPKGDKVSLVDGEWVGANPHEEFVGDPYSDEEGTFGVFEEPILQTIDTFLPDKGINLTGQDFEPLLDIVRSGKPVMAWTTIEQKRTFHSKTWTDDEGNQIEWNRYEHAVVITGINEEDIIVNDPYTGGEEYYDRELFEYNWASMGKRAVTLDVNRSIPTMITDQNNELDAIPIKNEDKVVTTLSNSIGTQGQVILKQEVKSNHLIEELSNFAEENTSIKGLLLEPLHTFGLVMEYVQYLLTNELNSVKQEQIPKQTDLNAE